MTCDESSDTTYNTIERVLDYVPTSKTTGYAKLRLSVREFKSDTVKVNTYGLAIEVQP